MREAMRRRVTAFKTRFAARRSRGAMPGGHQHDMDQPGSPPDVYSVRAKSSRHGKSTADKWNQ